MRIGLVLCGFLAVLGCAPAVPNSATGRGVGFGPPAGYEPVEATGTPAVSGPFVAAQRISPEGGATFESAATTSAAPAPAATVSENHPGISDEQDFAAVASRESIESDRARLEAQRDAYKVIRPGVVPTRHGDTGPSIVEYALSTNRPVGQSAYGRTGLSGQNRFDRNCAKYASPDLAQAAFLAAGGPERDRMGLDPDGDGYACYWDPTPFRAALGR